MATVATSPPPRPLLLTWEDLESLPEDGRRYEILDGELQVTPAPNTTHQRISRNLEFILHTHVSAHLLGEVLDAPVDVFLDRTTVVQPDLVFVSAARLRIISERAVEGAPDLVIEILSPGTAQRDRGAKQQIYARYGVAHYWLVDGSARTLSELVLREQAYDVRATHLPGTPVLTALFPTLPIDLAAVFPPPPTWARRAYTELPQRLTTRRRRALRTRDAGAVPNAREPRSRHLGAPDPSHRQTTRPIVATRAEPNRCDAS